MVPILFKLEISQPHNSWVKLEPHPHQPTPSICLNQSNMPRQRIDLSDNSKAKKEDEVPDEGASTSSCQEKVSKQQEMNARFRYGNYNQYYGMRVKGFERDPRLELMPVDWFKGKGRSLDR